MNCKYEENPDLRDAYLEGMREGMVQERLCCVGYLFNELVSMCKAGEEYQEHLIRLFRQYIDRK